MRGRGFSLLLLALPVCAYAGGVKVAPHSGATDVYKAPNGAPVVNIDTANKHGLSHNKFVDYNVGEKGLILNNGSLSQNQWNSQLAGKLFANPNLGASAKVILNEVVSTNPSVLNGFTEVVGKKADVVVANPYGITCDGCGFINTDRVTLSTGEPRIVDGALHGLKVGRGRILIDGSGLNASNQHYLDLVSRSVELAGAINAQVLGIYAGAGTWDYRKRQMTPATDTDTDNRPDHAVSSNADGAIYAGRITIKATEAGVGVRLLGDAAAGSGDFTIDAAGRIEVDSAVSAPENIALETEASGAKAISLDHARITAGGDLKLTAAGGAELVGGTLMADGRLAVDAASLDDRSSNGSRKDNNKRFGAAGVNVDVDGVTEIGGVSWASDADQQWRVGGLTVAAPDTRLYGDNLSLTATGGDLELNGARIVANHDLDIDVAGLFSTTAGTHQAVMSKAGDVTLDAAGGVHNAGVVAARDGNLVLAADGTLTNTGTVYAGNDLRIDAASGAANENIVNSGAIESGRHLAVDAATLQNKQSGTVLAGSGSNISVDRLTNAGALVASNDATAAVVKADTLTNAAGATLQAQGPLSLVAANSVGNQGKLLAVGDLTVAASDGAAYTLADTGTIQSGGVLCISGSSGCGTGDALSADPGVDLTVTGDGVLLGNSLVVHGHAMMLDDAAVVGTNGDLSLGLNKLKVADGDATIIGARANDTSAIVQVNGAMTNNGTIQAGHYLAVFAGGLTNPGAIITTAKNAGMELNASGTLTNGGVIGYAGEQGPGGFMLIGAETLDNLANGRILAGSGSLISVSTLNNKGTLTASRTDASATIDAGAITNARDGRIQAAGDLVLALHDGALTNNGLVFAEDGLTVSGSDYAIANSGLMQGKNALCITGTSGCGTSTSADGDVDVTVSGDGQLFARSLVLHANKLSLQGDAVVGITGDSYLGLNNFVVGQQAALVGATQSGRMRMAVAGAAVNKGTLESGNDLAVTAGSLVNTGELLAVGADSDLDLEVDGTLTNNGGVIGSGRHMTLNANKLSNSGNIVASSGSSIQVKTLENSGVLVASTDDTAANLDMATLDNKSKGVIQSAGSVSVTVRNDGSVTNEGQLLVAGDLALQGGKYELTDSGAIQSGGRLCIASRDFCANGTTQKDMPAIDVTLTGDGVLSAGTLVLRGHDLTLNNKSKLSTAGNMILHGHDIKLASSDAAIMGAMSGGTALVQASNAFENKGAVHSKTDLEVVAAQLDNTGTGGISAGHNLVLKGTDMLDNGGALYAGNAMGLHGGDIVNREAATVNSNGSITSDSDNFTNHGAIVAKGDIALTVKDAFINATWFDGKTISKTLGDVYDARDMTTIDQIANEGDFDKGMNAWIKEDRISRKEHLNGISAKELDKKVKAQILSIGSKGVLTIHYGASGLNSIAVLSAPTIKLVADNPDPTSGKSDPTFKNKALVLYKFDYTRRWIEVDDQKQMADDHEVGWARRISTADCSLYCAKADDDQWDSDNWGPTHSGPGWVRVPPKDEGEGYVAVDGGGFPDDLRDTVRKKATDGAVRDGIKDVDTFGAGIFADDLVVKGGNFENDGSPYGDDPDDAKRSGGPGGSIDSIGGSAADPVDAGHYEVGGLVATDHGPVDIPSSKLTKRRSLPGKTSFSDLAPTWLPPIQMPSSPNGHFVKAQDPSADYLIEVNPLFTSGRALGSDYLADKMGLDTDEIGLRLGDAAYEQYLIRQQLINQTGSNRLKGNASESGMIESLYDSAAKQQGQLGLVWGEPLSEQQVASLDHSLVWMVRREMDGQSVLTPVVYLSQSAREAFTGGAQVAANNAVFDVNSMTNTGGTISGSDNLVIKSQQDISNISGTLKGGNVYLKSVNGSIENKTLTKGAGDRLTFHTTIGKKAGIQSKNELLLDAGKDITNIGADISAGGNALIKAGNDITFDTIKTKNTRTTHQGGSSHNATNTHTTIDNIGSNVDIGGSLATQSGNDTTIAGSTVNVGGDYAGKAGGSFNLEARQDQEINHSVEKKQGFGVGGGLYGKQETTVDDFDGTNHGSTLNIGGNGHISAGEDYNQVGSKLDFGGSGMVEAKGDVNILDGLDEHHRHTRTETQTYLSVGSDSGASASAGTGTDASAPGPLDTASASAEASAGASTENHSSLNFYKKSVTDTQEDSKHSVGSEVSAGGNLVFKSGHDINVRGSDVKSDNGSIGLSAGHDVNILSGTNTHTKTTHKSSTSVGVFVDSDAGASASAGANAEAGVGTGADAHAGVEASASAGSTATLGERHKTSTDRVDDLTHSGSTINAENGSVIVNAGNNATFEGADVNAGDNIDISATNIFDKAAEDHHTESHHSTSRTTGAYTGRTADAGASASADAGTAGMGVDADAQAGAHVHAGSETGFRNHMETHDTNSGSTHNQTTSFTAGGDVNRHASGEIVDEGVQIKAGGNINQSADTIVDKAVHDQSWSDSSDTTRESKVGVTGDAGASAGYGVKSGSESGVELSVGVQASHGYEHEESGSSSGKAVTSHYQAGGSINSTSENKTSLEGTSMQAGDDINLNAGELDYKAAHDTSSESSSNRSGEVGVHAKYNVLTEKVSGGASGSYGQGQSSKDSSTAVTGGLSAGGNVNIHTSGDTTLEGTQVDAGKGINIQSDNGDVNLKAAHDTAHGSEKGFNVEADVSVKKKSVGGSVSGGHNQSRSESSESTGVSLHSAGGDIDISSGDDTRLEGTDIDAGDNAVNIKAGDEVSLGKSVDESSSEHTSSSAGISYEDSPSASADIDGGLTHSKDENASHIAGDSITIQGDSVENHDADLDSDSVNIRE